MTYQQAAVPMTLSDVEGHTRHAFCNMIFLDYRAAVGKISTDIDCCTVPLWEMSFLF